MNNKYSRLGYNRAVIYQKWVAMSYPLSYKKFTMIVNLVKEWNNEAKVSDISEVIDSDWQEGDDHIKWLKNASAKDIASWVIGGLH